MDNIALVDEENIPMAQDEIMMTTEHQIQAE